MNRIRIVLVGAVALVALAFAATAGAARSQAGAGGVYVLTNTATGNAVAAYNRDANGALVPQGVFATGGNGTGALLGDQGALVLASGGKQLLAVNAGSNSVTAFAVGPNGLVRLNTVDSGGTTPVSVTQHGRIVYVLNAGGAGNVSGFVLTAAGLQPLQGSTQPLGAGAAGAAQVEFSPDGKLLAVTEKGASTIDVFPVAANGYAGAAVRTPSVGATPFGFDFDKAGHLVTSNASGSASSYALASTGATAISGAVAANQTAPCWLVVAKSGRYAYTANGGSGTISRFAVAADGSLSLLDPAGAAAADLGAGSHPLDLALSADGRFLYNLTDGKHRVSVFRVAGDGSLTPIESIGDLPVGAEGIAAS